MNLRTSTARNVLDKPAARSPLRPMPTARPRHAASAPGAPGRDDPAGDPGAAEYASWLRLLRPTAS